MAVRSPLLLSVAIAVFCLTFLVFSPALDYEFLNWDDEARILESPEIRGLDPYSIQQMFATFRVSNYTPLERLSCAIDYQIWGFNPWGFHFTNIVFHCLNASLVFCLAWRLFSISTDDGQPKRYRFTLACAISALAFSLHPLRIESVVWISERRDVLCLFWTLLSTLVYLEANLTPIQSIKRGRYHLLAFLFFILALLSKATAVILPIILLLLDIYPLKRIKHLKSEASLIVKCVGEKFPYLMLSLVLGLVAIWGQQDLQAMPGLASYPLAPRIAHSFKSIIFYIQQWILPWSLSPFYPSPSAMASWWQKDVLLSASCFFVVSIYSIFIFKKRPALSLAWWSYVFLILPFSGLLQAGIQAAADRYTYFSTIPFALLLGVGLYQVLRTDFQSWIHVLTASFCCLLIFAYAVGTWQLLPIWKNSSTLWEYTIRIASHDQIPLNNFSSALTREKRYYLAKVMAREAIRRSPDWDSAWHNYAVALSLAGNRDLAIEAFHQTLKINPNSGSSHFALANLLYLKGDFRQAQVHYFQSLQDGLTPERLTNLGITLYQNRQPDFAMKYLSWAAKQNYSRAFMLWADIHGSAGNYEIARALLSEGHRRTQDPQILRYRRKFIEKDAKLSNQEKQRLLQELPNSN
jgi:protein O-mannosyl-transferase